VVIPLRYGAGVKGKTVEAMHHSLPFVSTTIGVEGLENIKELTDSYDTPEEFANRVIELYNDDEKLKIFSRNGATYANKYLSEEKTKDLVQEVFS
jgi:glycosyltransferase involved in cell wall biosynthesis